MSIKYTKEDKYAELKKRLNDTIDSEKEQRQKIKDLEIKNGELSKKNFEFQSHLQNLIIKMNLISQENSTLKLEIKKLQLSVNSPGKVVASLGTTNKSDLSTDNLLKEKSELKEENEKLLLMLSDKESILSKQKIEYENEINDLNKIITEQTGKINDITNDMTDLQQQLNIKIKEIKKLKEENDEINLCKSKKKPQKLIDEASKRMYDEAKRRKIKMNEKIDRINKYNNEIEDASKYTKKIKSESYTFIDEDDLNDNTNNNRLSYNDFYVGKNIVNKKEKMRKTKGMSVSEFNNKRFDKRPRTGKSYNGKSINNKMNQKYFNDYMKKK